jgi:hypothetical protein
MKYARMRNIFVKEIARAIATLKPFKSKRAIPNVAARRVIKAIQTNT